MAKKKYVIASKTSASSYSTNTSAAGSWKGAVSLSTITKASTAKKKKAAASKKKGASGKKKPSTSKKKKAAASLGKFGNLITFSVSDKKIMTFGSLKREGEGRWKEHALIGRKPRKQFLGPDNETVTITITLDARHGVKPRKTLENIISYRDKGKADYLIIKGQKVCSNKMVIVKTSDTWDEVWNRGELVRADIDITFEEYS